MDDFTTDFDTDFQKVPGLTWLPWVGRDYPERSPGKRLLLVGESHYVRAATPELLESVIKQHLASPHLTRDIISQCSVHADWRNRTLDTLPKVLFRTTEIDRTRFWKDTAFYNFVQRPMHYNREGQPERPSADEIVLGWQVFADVVRLLQPSYCLFIGVGAANFFNQSMASLGVPFDAVKWTERIGRTWARVAAINVGSSLIRLVFVQHLGKFFSWGKWNAYLRAHHESLIGFLEEERYENARNI